ncbi:MAG: multidrug efflux SMR transporter [Pseudomonadota bacterium]
MQLAWVLLAVTILLEVAGSICMKLSNGFAAFWPSVGVFVFYAAAFATLTIVLKTIELSIAYAIWAGAGTALIAAIGILAFGESTSSLKLASLALVVLGVIGLNLASQA